MAALVAFLAGGCGKGTSSQAAAADSEAQTSAPAVVEAALASVRPMETTVVAQGNLAAAQGSTAQVSAVAPGQLVSVRVKEGDRVTAGQVVAVVSSTPQQAQARSAQAALTASVADAQRARLAQRAAQAQHDSAVQLARLSLESAKADRASAVTQAQTALDLAQTELKKVKAGSRPQEIAQAEAAVAKAKVNRDQCSTELKRVQFLFGKGIDSQRQLDDAKASLGECSADYESAQQHAALLKAGARPEDLQAAELQVTQAQQALAQAKKAGDAKVAQAQAALTQAEQQGLQVDVQQAEAQAAQAAVAQKTADLTAAEATASYATLRAPLSGIVTRRDLNPGDIADPSSPVLEISDTRVLDLLASMPAGEGAQVAPGMTARVTVPGLPGKVFAGQVVSVGQVDPQSNLLTARISVTNPQNRLRIGTFAQAVIVVHTDNQAVVVPKQAVINQEGKSAIFVVGPDNIAHRHLVTLGPQSDGVIQIKQGVQAGERVVTLGQYELGDGDKVQLEAAGASGASGTAGASTAGAGAGGSQAAAQTSATPSSSAPPASASQTATLGPAKPAAQPAGVAQPKSGQ